MKFVSSMFHLQLFYAGFILSNIGYCAGWFIALAFHLEYRDRIAIGCESTIQNTGNVSIQANGLLVLKLQNETIVQDIIKNKLKTPLVTSKNHSYGSVCSVRVVSQ